MAFPGNRQTSRVSRLLTPAAAETGWLGLRPGMLHIPYATVINNVTPRNKLVNMSHGMSRQKVRHLS
jgi:hypothetical protein